MPAENAGTAVPAPVSSEQVRRAPLRAREEMSQRAEAIPEIAAPPGQGPPPVEGRPSNARLSDEAVWQLTTASDRLTAQVIAELTERGVQEAKREAFEAGPVTWNPGGWNLTLSTGNTITVGPTYGGGLNNSYFVSASSGYTSTVTFEGNQWVTRNTPWEEAGEGQREYWARRDQEAAGQQARDAAYREEREAARERSEELLTSLLSDAQRATYAEHGWFEVRGSHGGRWRIRSQGQSGNVDLMPETGEEREAAYCAHPPGYLPDADAYAAQMLALVTDEEAFLRTANVHWRRPARPGPGAAAA